MTETQMKPDEAVQSYAHWPKTVLAAEAAGPLRRIDTHVAHRTS